MTTDERELIEQLADAEHASWAHWMEYLFSVSTMHADGSCTIPSASVQHWQRQVRTPYDNLTEREKQSDRDEVAKILPFIHAAAQAEARGREQELLDALTTARDALDSCAKFGVQSGQSSQHVEQVVQRLDGMLTRFGAP